MISIWTVKDLTPSRQVLPGKGQEGPETVRSGPGGQTNQCIQAKASSGVVTLLFGLSYPGWLTQHL